jgi:hypothetical protein
MQRLRVDFRMGGKFWKSDRRVDVITQDLFSQRHITCQKAFDGIAKKALSEGCVASHSRLNRLPKILC